MSQLEEGRQVRLLFKYDGAGAALGELGIHDASVALRGITRATVITAYAFLNEGKVRTRTDSFKGGRVYVQAPRRGSYEQIVRIIFDPEFLVPVVVTSVFANAFWEFTKWTWSKAVGKLHEPDLPPQLYSRMEPRVGDLASALRDPLEEVHRPIEEEGASELALIRPHVGRVLTLDEETLAFVSKVTESSDEILLSGNVTRFNVLTGFGRLFDDGRGETVSFLTDQGLSDAARTWITWSLDQRVRHNPGKLIFSARKVTARGDEVVRYLVTDVRGATPTASR